ncbi:hypothetical protein LV564_06155 [Komagataeibacter nataicola]|uniref:hypothetical protein n=1 Tax=Komagataeibacter nataicola TaxID=265960 RepID=UPI0011B7ED70|nr:hypothetical protein [Komagataeibacter nataicola]WEQ56658.1 hypothetical protein LV564_06155 [Komagataeibacter nataicola]WNM08127.1 hypothetical protein RI056_14600 [Komagataeibacter nataicola]
MARFSPTIRNPQGNDTQGNPYSADEFLTGWQAGNILAIGVMESASPAECAMRTIPHDVLVRSWEWNVTLVARREQLERDQFIPRMIYLLIEGQARTAIIWGDGVAAVLPQVDYVLVAQVHEGERRFGCVSWDYFSTVMQQAGHAAHEGFDLYEPQGPGLVSALIETAMPFNRETMGILQADVVLDEADVRAALAA